jgi:hypothetical protein
MPRRRSRARGARTALPLRPLLKNKKKLVLKSGERHRAHRATQSFGSCESFVMGLGVSQSRELHRATRLYVRGAAAWTMAVLSLQHRRKTSCRLCSRPRPLRHRCPRRRRRGTSFQ